MIRTADEPRAPRSSHGAGRAHFAHRSTTHSPHPQAGIKQFPTSGPLAGFNLWPHTNGQFLGAYCVGGEVGYTTSIAGTDAFPISINLGYDNTTDTVDGAPYGRADSGPCGDHRDIATSDGMVTVVQTLTVNENGNVSFSVNLPGCPVLERKIGNSFDPTKDAWVIIVTDDDNLHFVEIEKVGVYYAEGTFKDIPALQLRHLLHVRRVRAPRNLATVRLLPCDPIGSRVSILLSQLTSNLLNLCIISLHVQATN